ncbi:MAG: helix-turn-helix domain-containing protein [bacterium]|nr:helix-turn-helix domain-containing protein [bacterium]
MDEKLFKELCESVEEAILIDQGRLEGAEVVFGSTGINVAAIRKRYKLSQPKFAQLLGVSVNSLRNWEQGKRQPTGPARTLLKVAALHPSALIDAVEFKVTP